MTLNTQVDLNSGLGFFLKHLINICHNDFTPAAAPVDRRSDFAIGARL